MNWGLKALHRLIFPLSGAVVGLLLVSSIHAARSDDFPGLIENGASTPPWPSSKGGIIGSEFRVLGSALYFGVGGNLYDIFAGRPTTQTYNQVIQNLSTPPLNTYFTDPKERESIAQSIVGQVKKIAPRAITSARNRQIDLIIAHNLIPTIIDRVLQGNGVDQKKRRDLWSTAILGNFDGCVRLTMTGNQADACYNQLVNNLPNNLSLAVVHELSKSQFGLSGKPLQREDKLFKLCLEAKNDANGCALVAMRSGAKAYASGEIQDSARPYVAATGVVRDQINAALKVFNACVNKATDEASFTTCGQQLSQSAGKQIAYSAVLNNEQINTQINDPKQMQQLATTASNEMEDCLKKKGFSHIDDCQLQLTKDTAGSVARIAMNNSIGNTLDTQTRDGLVNPLVSSLQDCIGNDASDDHVNVCINQLEKNAGTQISATVLPTEFNSYFAKSGGLSAFGLDSKSEGSLLDQEDEARSTCIAQLADGSDPLNSLDPLHPAIFPDTSDTLHVPLAPGSSDTATSSALMDQIQDCIKDSIKRLVEKVANLEFEHTARPLFSKNQQSQASSIEASGAGFLDNCLTQAANQNLDDYQKSLMACSDQTSRKMTVAVPTFLGDEQAKSLLGVKTPPKQVTDLDTQLQTCVTNAAGDAAVNACVTNYQVSMARTIGPMAVESTLRAALGSGYDQSKVGALESDFQSCLDNVSSTMKDETDQSKISAAVKKCGDNLQTAAQQLVSQAALGWLNTPDQTPEAAQVKSQVAQILPCLAGLQSSAPGPSDSANNDLENLLAIIGKTIDYDPDVASKQLPATLKDLESDLNTISSDQAKENLISALESRGLLDQLIKSMIRSQIQDAESGLPADEKALVSPLLDRTNFDKIFDSTTMASLRKQVTDKILKPVLIDGKDFNSPGIQQAQKDLTDPVATALAHSPYFGRVLVDKEVQSNIQQQGALTRFFVRFLYGKKALKWANVQKTPKGQAAENYILDQILVPMFEGKTVPKDQTAQEMAEAKDLVTTAIEHSWGKMGD